MIDQVSVAHYPRDGGAPTGMRPRVVARALLELARMYPGLRPAPGDVPPRSGRALTWSLL